MNIKVQTHCFLVPNILKISTSVRLRMGRSDSQRTPAIFMTVGMQLSRSGWAHGRRCGFFCAQRLGKSARKRYWQWALETMLHCTPAERNRWTRLTSPPVQFWRSPNGWTWCGDDWEGQMWILPQLWCCTFSTFMLVLTVVQVRKVL